MKHVHQGITVKSVKGVRRCLAPTAVNKHVATKPYGQTRRALMGCQPASKDTPANSA